MPVSLPAHPETGNAEASSSASRQPKKVVIDVAGYTPGPDTTHYIVRGGSNPNVAVPSSGPPLKLRQTAIARVNAPPTKDLDMISAQGIVDHMKHAWQKGKEKRAIAREARKKRKESSKETKPRDWESSDDGKLLRLVEMGKTFEEIALAMPGFSPEACENRLNEHLAASKVLIA